MGFLETADLAKADSFRARLLSCTVAVAGVVLAEDTEGTPVAWSLRRQALALSVMRDPYTQVGMFIWPVLANPAIASAGLAAPDGDLQYQVTQIWDMVAGVTASDKVTPE